jgi:succinoglycan biosynthesis protein ExoV
MSLYYWKCSNFGDQLNEWLWPRLMGDIHEHPSHLFIGIGTILTVDVPAAIQKFVFGTGAGYKDPPRLDRSWDISCVRGRITSSRLGLDDELAVGDAATLVHTLMSEIPAYDDKKRDLFIPHHFSTTFWDWREYCQHANLEYLDPATDPYTVMRKIRSANVVYTEAMHGAILSDALRVPWVPLKIYPHINTEKWCDWLSVTDVKYKPVDLRPFFQDEFNYPVGKIARGLPDALAKPLMPIANRISSAVINRSNRRLMQKASPSLSSDRNNEFVVSRLSETLDALVGRIAAFNRSVECAI